MELKHIDLLLYCMIELSPPSIGKRAENDLKSQTSVPGCSSTVSPCFPVHYLHLWPDQICLHSHCHLGFRRWILQTCFRLSRCFKPDPEECYGKAWKQIGCETIPGFVYATQEPGMLRRTVSLCCVDLCSQCGSKSFTCYVLLHSTPIWERSWQDVVTWWPGLIQECLDSTQNLSTLMFPGMMKAVSLVLIAPTHLSSAMTLCLVPLEILKILKLMKKTRINYNKLYLYWLRLCHVLNVIIFRSMVNKINA